MAGGKQGHPFRDRKPDYSEMTKVLVWVLVIEWWFFFGIGVITVVELVLGHVEKDLRSWLGVLVFGVTAGYWIAGRIKRFRARHHGSV